MAKGVSFCSPGTIAAAAAEMMVARSCDVLLVLDDNGRVAGVVTDDHLSAVLSTQARNVSALPVTWIMSQTVYTPPPEDAFTNDVMRTLAVHR